MLSLFRDALTDDGDDDGPGPSRERGHLGAGRIWDDDLETMLMPEVQAALADDVRSAHLASRGQRITKLWTLVTLESWLRSIFS